MKSCPISLRVETDDPQTASGIYLYDEAAKSDFVVSISTPFSKQLRLTRGKASGALDVSMDVVLWEDLELVKEVGLTRVSEQIAGLGNDFNVVPDSEFTLLVFRFVDAGDAETRGRHARNLFFVDTRVNKTKVLIRSSPLAGHHASLFHGYTSTGIVSFVSPEFLCLDARYLDGMEGADVSGLGFNDGNIGLLAGCLIKSNGQGRLTLVVPWRAIIEALSGLELVHSLRSQLSAPVPVERPWAGVVVVQLKLKGNRVSWGSGVLIGPDLVVTNHHVVSPNYSSVSVWLERRYPYTVAAISQPVEGIDLVFLKLSKHAPGKYTPVPLAAKDPPINTPVRSRGYGLFLPHRHGGALQPLTSEGIINKSVDGMLISSAGCWNGSSGGALLNTKGELVGVMASNGRDNKTGEIIPELAFIIPVSVVRKALDHLNASDGAFPAVTSEKFKKLWKLQKTHRDVRRAAQARL